MALVQNGMQDSARTVRSAACVCLTALAQHCTPEITEYHETVLPAIMGCVQDSDNEVQERACVALEQFLDSMESDVEPYLPSIMDLLNVLTGMSLDAHQTAVSCLGALALACPEAFRTYVDPVMGHLKSLLGMRELDQLPLLCQALDTAGLVASCCPRSQAEAGSGHVQDMFTAVLQVIREVDDPDVRVASFTMFGSFARLLEDSFAPCLPTIMPLVLNSTRAAGVHRTVVPQIPVSLSGLGNEDDEDDEDDDGFIGAVHTSEMPEAEAAMQLLAALAKFCRLHFGPYLAQGFEACARCVADRYQATIPSLLASTYKASVELCITQMAIALQNPDLDAQLWTPSFPAQPPLTEELQSPISHTTALLLQALQGEEDKEVACDQLEALHRHLQGCGPYALAAPGHVDAVQGLLLGFVGRRAKCQVEDYEHEAIDPDEDPDDEESLAELEMLLMEYVGECIVALVKALGPSGTALATTFLQPLSYYVRPRRATAPERNFCIGTVAEMIEGLESGAQPIERDLYTLIQPCLRDSDAEICGNAVYAAGLLMEHGTEAIQSTVPELMGVLLGMVQVAPDDEEGLHARDNAMGCASRILARQQQTSAPALGLDQQAAVLAQIVEALPLQQDLSENRTVMAMLRVVRESGRLSVTPQQWHAVLHALFSILLTGTKVENDIRAALVDFLRFLTQAEPDVFSAVVGSLNHALQEEVRALLH
ncbi:uncharacterized protein MONBRDRAFT_35836 [Monosiga brevicollis MX1]|uniref:Importin subunit beta-1/Transportin-1-like TPR repeats domain-containing protein n=1 Tax=Monosiga brevicollis TaxID=81824 RepID=A9US41_MONBE|nr:uncharacterized protein MONBRDRAFT_35836 [Monosiga brevicollis MX1]EDQ92037.1 predicted protein [Monosiga brevicollis MX1]|eukprot:XP_001743323.1 hypothetical protein [Monosiga brevicollis MX1]